MKNRNVKHKHTHIMFLTFYKKEPMNISKENITSIATDLKKSEFFMGLVSTTAIFKNS